MDHRLDILFETSKGGAREMAQQFGVLADLLGNPSSVYSTHVRWLTTAYT